MKNSVALIITFTYPSAFYLAWKFVMPIMTATIEISKIHFTEFPLIIVHGLIVVLLYFGFFGLFFIGLYIWVLSIQQIGVFLLEMAFKKGAEK